eukprot:TRINITY_DN23951_c0_g1_i1.p2 TRINITY_DN23951_c0_g1~~TRINITY_DN23951_c0_g1_i1.p2  ORF type:complete len:127 (+),score=22.89 TRINITY_DN23951_c0_g1_i1:471-851(+)
MRGCDWRIGVVSCNSTSFQHSWNKTNMWKRLWLEYVEHGELDLLLHIGDQVYNDDQFNEARKLVIQAGGLEEVTPELEERIMRSIRAVYRATWNEPYTRGGLASVPSLMIWDGAVFFSVLVSIVQC